MAIVTAMQLIPVEDMAPRHVKYYDGITVIENHDTGDECEVKYRTRVLMWPVPQKLYWEEV